MWYRIILDVAIRTVFFPRRLHFWILPRFIRSFSFLSALNRWFRFIICIFSDFFGRSFFHLLFAFCNYFCFFFPLVFSNSMEWDGVYLSTNVVFVYQGTVQRARYNEIHLKSHRVHLQLGNIFVHNYSELFNLHEAKHLFTCAYRAKKHDPAQCFLVRCSWYNTSKRVRRKWEKRYRMKLLGCVA